MFNERQHKINTTLDSLCVSLPQRERRIVISFIRFVTNEANTLDKIFQICSSYHYYNRNNNYFDSLMESFDGYEVKNDKELIYGLEESILRYFTIYYNIEDFNSTVDEEDNLLRLLKERLRKEKINNLLEE